MSLNFRVNCPTAVAFANYFLELVPSDTMQESEKEAIMELVKQQIKLAVATYELVGVNKSAIALLALSNALYCTEHYSAYERDFVGFVANFAGISLGSIDQHLQYKLYNVVEECVPVYARVAPRKTFKTVEGSGSPDGSPRCVCAPKAMTV